MTEAVRSWVERSRYDLDTAGAMLASGRYLYVVFCCQQAVEKALKAVITAQTGTLPPRIHNLLRLAEAAKIELPADRAVPGRVVGLLHPVALSRGDQCFGVGRHTRNRAENFGCNEGDKPVAVLDARIRNKALLAADILARAGVVRAAYIFGSYADGHADQWSDIDLAAFVEGVESWDLEKRARIMALVMREAGADVETHLFPASKLATPEPGGFAEYVLQHGVCIQGVASCKL